MASTFKQFVNQVQLTFEEMNLVHKSAVPTAGAWALRKDKKDEKRPVLVTAMDKITIKNPKPFIDHDAVENGDKVVAYIRGERVKSVKPDGEGRAVGYFKDQMLEPFRYIDDKTAFKGAELAIFDGNSFMVY